MIVMHFILSLASDIVAWPISLTTLIIALMQVGVSFI